MTLELRTTPGAVRVTRNTDTGFDVVQGYAAVFYDPGDPGTEYELWDDLVERIDPDAFSEVLANRDDTRALFNHDSDNLLARVAANTLRLSVDQTGLRYEYDVNNDDSDHVRVREKIERGDLTGSSFAFVIGSQRFDSQEDGPDIRTILSVRELRDVGPVTFPAYDSTTAGLRSDGSLDEVIQAHDAWKAAVLEEQLQRICDNTHAEDTVRLAELRRRELDRLPL